LHVAFKENAIPECTAASSTYNKSNMADNAIEQSIIIMKIINKNITVSLKCTIYSKFMCAVFLSSLEYLVVSFSTG